jgi:putative peptide zinc metalloprotease protein
MAPMEIQARDAAHVYVDVPGILEKTHVEPGQVVGKDQELARLASPDLELRILQKEAERSEAESRLENLRQQYRFQDARTIPEMIKVQNSLESIKKQLEQLEIDRSKLVLRAPTSGTVLPPPWKPHREDPEGGLSSWFGTPLLPENLGCFFDETTHFCQIGNPEEMEAILYVDQGDIGFVDIGQDVEVKVDELPHDRLHGQVVEISPDAVKIVPQHMSTKSKGELPTETDETGKEIPQSASFQVRVYLDDPEGLLRLALRGRAKVHCAPQTLATRLWRLVTDVFNFRL